MFRVMSAWLFLLVITLLAVKWLGLETIKETIPKPMSVLYDSTGWRRVRFISWRRHVSSIKPKEGSPKWKRTALSRLNKYEYRDRRGADYYAGRYGCWAHRAIQS